MVQVKVFDFYSKEDLLCNRIIIVSVEGIVEFVGIVFIEVEQGGQQFCLKFDKLIWIQMVMVWYNL